SDASQAANGPQAQRNHRQSQHAPIPIPRQTARTATPRADCAPNALPQREPAAQAALHGPASRSPSAEDDPIQRSLTAPCSRVAAIQHATATPPHPPPPLPPPRTTKTNNAIKPRAPRPIRPRKNNRLRNARVPNQRGLDLPRLNAETANLNLMVRTPHKLQNPIPAPARQVPAAVHPAPRSAKAVPNKTLPRPPPPPTTPPPTP